MLLPAERSDVDHPEPPSPLRGEIVYLYAFDVANEIRLDRASKLLPAKPARAAGRERPAPRDIPIPRPLNIELPPPAVRLGGSPFSLGIRVFDVGVVGVIVRVPFARKTLDELMPFHSPILDDGRPLDELVRRQCGEIRARLADSLVRPGPEADPEAYTAFCFTYLEGERDANHWLANNQREAAGLLTGVPGGQLSEIQVAEVLRLRRSFESTDLVVIDWDAALVAELDGSAEEVLHVLEVANLQLEEFRWMDRSLDRYMERAYGDMGRRRWWALGATTSVLRSLRQLRIDLTKLADEVTHITKFVGDWHLARVYLLARKRFHLEQWRASVDQRLGELDRLYTMIRGDLYDRRMLWLEIVIVIFFAVDLVILLVK